MRLAGFGVLKKLRRRRVSTTRPRCSNTMSPASRRASPRSCVDITTLMPRLDDGAHDILYRLRGGRVEACRRFIEKQYGRIAGERARKRKPLLLAARHAPRRPVGEIRETDKREQFGNSRRRARCAGFSRLSSRSGCSPRRCAGASSDAGTRWRVVSARANSRPPQVMRPEVGAISPMAARNSVVLPEPFGPISTVGAPALIDSVTVIENRHRPGAGL